MQIGPFRRNDRPASVGKHHDQVQSSLLMPGPQNSKRLTLERMVWSTDFDVFGEVVEVGSVCGLRSTIRTSALSTICRKRMVLASLFLSLWKARRWPSVS